MRKKYLISSAFACTAALLMHQGLAAQETTIDQGIAQSLQEEVALVSVEDNTSRDLHSISWDSFTSDQKYNKFWTWYWDWSKNDDCTSKNKFNYQASGVSKDLALKIVKRKACTSTKTLNFGVDIEINWSVIWDLWAQYTWSFTSKSKSGYGSWKYTDTYCSNGYYKDSNKKCQQCPIGCSDCLGTSQCTACSKNFTYIEGYTFGYCVSDCPRGQYVQTLYTDMSSYQKKTGSKTPTISASKCEACPPGCDDCIWDDSSSKVLCYECKKGFQFNTKNGSCTLTTCENGQYRNKPVSSYGEIKSTDKSDDYVCRDCSKGCKNCSSNTTCNKCFENYILVGPSSSSSNKQCYACPAFCKTCTFDNNLKDAVCSQCQERFVPSRNGKECNLNRTCGAGQWFNDASLVCESCPDNCVSCKQGSRNGTVTCDKCATAMKLDEKTNQCKDACQRDRQYFSSNINDCITCKNGTWPDQDSQQCKPCSKYCDDCSYQRYKSQNDDSDTCSSSSGFEFSVTIGGVTIIWKNNDNKTDNNSKGTSKALPLGSEDCYRCANGSYYVPSQRKCRINCSNNQMFNFTSMQCQTCGKDQYLNKTYETCDQCPKNCTTCEYSQGKNRPSCTSCGTGFIIDPVEKLCRPNCANSTYYFDWKYYSCKPCPAGTIIDDTTKTCQSCPNDCSTCSKNKTSGKIQCDKCKSGKVLDSEKKLCRQSCPSWQTYYWETQTCRECPPYQSYAYDTKNCQNCSFGCIECFSRFNNRTTPTCITCDDKTIFDVKTFQCKLQCNSSTTFNYDTLQCEACQSGYYFDSLYGKCKACTNKNCAECYKEKSSSYYTQCSLCNDGYNLDSNGECQAPCPANTYFNYNKSVCVSCSDGTYYDQSDKSCEDCPDKCTTCKNDGQSVVCGGCKSGYILDQTSKRCREPCQSERPFYNQTISYCQACPNKTYFDNKTSQCVSCPTNCPSCSLNSTGYVNCPSCLNNWLLDEQMKQCKPSCPSNQQYDWSLQKCTTCPAGTWLNSTYQKCQNCPKNCMGCNYFATNKSYTCNSCFTGSILDTTKMLCRPLCILSQYYDWSVGACVSCPTGQFLERPSVTCKTCPINCQSCYQNYDTNITECVVCKSGYIFDTAVKNCKMNCTQTTYYDWNTNTCKSCDAGKFLNPDYQACQSCPNGCASCSYDFTKKTVYCNSCNTGMILDTQQQLCRVSCNSTSYYDWTYNTCVNCKDSEYLDQSSQTCMACPAICPTCFFNVQQQAPQCTSCISGMVLDPQISGCREQCNSTSYFDYTMNICVQCKTGQWLNPSSQKCESCPTGCYSCQASVIDQTKPDCTQCFPGLVLDQAVCRKSCASNQFYDWSISDCKNCTAPCIQCSNSQSCSACDEQYNLQSNGSCTWKCVAGQETWNSVTKTCDSLRKFNITVSAGAIKIMRCRNTTVTAKGAGYYSTETPSYSWTVDIVKGGTSQSAWISDLNSIVAQANNNAAVSLIIPNTLTEKITDNTTLRFNVTMIVGTSQVMNSTQIVIEPYVFTQITNYSTSYTIYASDGLPIYPAFAYPECTLNKGPVPIPSTISIGCNLYDVNGNLIKSLPLCQIKPNEVSQGQVYSIKYYYVPSPYQTALRDTIKVTTVVQPTSCTIANASMQYARQADNLNFKVTVINSKTSFKYQWTCIPLTNGAGCGIVQTTQNAADLSIPASSLTLNGRYNFSLQIIDNSGTSPTTVASCSGLSEIVPDTPSTFQLSFIDNSNARNYIDPSQAQNVLCYQTQDTAAYVNYDWKVTRQSDNSVLYPNTASSSNFAKNGNQLAISANTLSSSGDTYLVQCSAYNLKYSGSLSKTYTTSQTLDTPITFSISPSSGQAQNTLFTLTVNKPSNSNLWCKFGYVTPSGDVTIPDNQTPVYPSSSQTLVTQLDKATNSAQQTLFTNCYDSTNAFARTTVLVTVN